MLTTVTEVISQNLFISESDVKKEIEKMDSLDCYHIVLSLEDEYDIEINDSEVEKCKNFEDIINLLRTKNISEELLK